MVSGAEGITETIERKGRVEDMSEPKYLTRWTQPQYYVGAEWPEYYDAGVGQSRDSDALERANFDAMLEALGGETGEEDNGVSGVRVVRESHWAVGWVEWIAIHETHETALKVADAIKGKLENYSVIDEERWSRYEDEECADVWSRCMNVAERAAYLRAHVHKVYPSRGDTAYRMLRRAVKGEWDAAANMLPCPSDLIA